MDLQDSDEGSEARFASYVEGLPGARSEPRAEPWRLVEWPQDEPKPTKLWFSSLPANTPMERLGYLARLRRLIAHALAQTLPRCPCRAQTIPHRQNHSRIL